MAVIAKRRACEPLARFRAPQSQCLKAAFGRVQGLCIEAASLRVRAKRPVTLGPCFQMAAPMMLALRQLNRWRPHRPPLLLRRLLSLSHACAEPRAL